VRNVACQAPTFFGRNGECEGGWVDQTLNKMRTEKVCTKKDVSWPFWCINDDCLECGGSWWADPGLDDSCAMDVLDGPHGTGSFRSVELQRGGNQPSGTMVQALKDYLQSEGSFGFSFATENAFMYHGSNIGGWFGGKCSDTPYKGGGDSCCKKENSNDCWGWWCSDNSGECDGDKGGHAVRVTGWGTTNGVEYWKMQNSWGTGWGEDGYMEISIYEGYWGWSRVNVDSQHVRRTLAELPEHGLDYLMNEEEHFGRFLEEDEIDPLEEPGSEVPIEIDSTVVELARAAMTKFNCTIVPATLEVFEEE
jgi:hypothetical protein